VRLAKSLGVVGLMNVQYAIKDGQVYVLEVNPRASRSIPYVAKATGVPWAAVAARAAAGVSLREQQILGEGEDCDCYVSRLSQYYVKEVVLPWRRFPGARIALGPEMRSTGEAMGSGPTFGAAFAKAQLGCGRALPTSGTAFLSVNDHDKRSLLPIAQGLAEQGFKLIATSGTAAVLRGQGIEVQSIYKINEGRPNASDYIINGQVDLVINTPLGSVSLLDEQGIRQAALRQSVICITTRAGARAAIEAIKAMREGALPIHALQD
jgi:carbamoyl-phosphate synthase large subunit